MVIGYKTHGIIVFDVSLRVGNGTRGRGGGEAGPRSSLGWRYNKNQNNNKIKKWREVKYTE